MNRIIFYIIIFAGFLSPISLDGKDYPLQSQVNLSYENHIIADDILNKIKNITAKQLDIKVDDITLESNFINDLGASELDVVEIILAAEKEFVINIPDDEAETLYTVGDLYNYVKENI